MALTTAEKLDIASISEYLSAVDIKKKGLYGGGVPVNLPEKIYIIRKSIAYWYALDPIDTTLVATSNYLLALCGLYGLEAQNVSGSGGSVAPVIGSQGFPIYITSSNFTSATFYQNTNIIGNNIVIFLNEINRYLIGSEFTVSSTGITINLTGFDATGFTYNLVIEKVYI